MLITKTIMDKLSKLSDEYFDKGTTNDYIKSLVIQALAGFLDGLWISWTIVVILTGICKLIGLFKRLSH